MALRILAELAEVESDARFISDDLSIVAGMECIDIARADLSLGAVVGIDLHSPGNDVAQMGDLARLRASDGLDIVAPLPAGLEEALADHMTANVQDVCVSVTFERASLIR